jgi:3',5'-cyclic AMP phosphodiesterase CpdA
METVRIAHLADLHLNALDHNESANRTRALLDCIRSMNVDHVVVTGDLTADASVEELEMFREIFSSYGLLSAEKLTVVIGNHDIYGGVHLAEDILTFPRRCKEIPYKELVRQFADTLPEPFMHCMYGLHKKPFPFVKPFGPFLFVGINTIARYSRLNNPFGSNGEVDEEQFEAVRTMLETPAIRKYPKIILLHHHFSKKDDQVDGTMHSLWSAIEQQTMKLRGKKQIMKLFREHDVRLILHGHVHENFEYERKGLRFLNGGGSVLGPIKDKLSFNLIAASESSMEVRHIMIDAPARTGPRRLHPARDRVLETIEREVAAQIPQRIAVNASMSI